MQVHAEGFGNDRVCVSHRCQHQLLSEGALPGRSPEQAFWAGLERGRAQLIKLWGP